MARRWIAWQQKRPDPVTVGSMNVGGVFSKLTLWDDRPGPVLDIAASYGKEKAGSRIIGATLKALKVGQRHDLDLLCDGASWFTRDQADAPPVRDRGSESGATLKAESISMLEIDAALRIARDDNAGGEAPELVRTAARLLGFRRVGPDLQSRIAAGLAALGSLPLDCGVESWCGLR